MKPITALAAAACLGIASGALAQNADVTSFPQPPFYIGAGIGQGHLNRGAAELSGLYNAELDDTDTTYTVRAGWRFNRYFAVELGYYDLGRYDFRGTALPGGAVYVNGSARAQSVGLSAVGILPIYNFDLYGRIGYARSQLKFNGNAFDQTAGREDKQNEATYGIGGRWNATRNWSLFVEWMKNDKIRVDSYLGGVDFRF